MQNFRYLLMVSPRLIASIAVFVCGFAGGGEAGILFSEDKKLNNLVSELLEVSSISESSKPFAFTRSSDGWIFVSSISKGKGTVSVILDKALGGHSAIVHEDERDPRGEGMRYV